MQVIKNVRICHRRNDPITSTQYLIVGFLADENNKTPLNLGLLVKLLLKNGLVIHGPITKEIPVSETN